MENTKDRKILVAGCGGLGCYIVENLIRMGIPFRVVDGDTFSESNLNRQLYATPKTLGQSKVLATKERAEEFNLEIEAVNAYITEENVEELLDGIDLIIDALDNTKARFILEDAAKVPIIHGAVGTWHYQVGIAMPGKSFLHNLYQNQDTKNVLETTAPTVQACAAEQTAEAVKVLNKEPSELENALLIASLKDNTYEIIKF